MEYHSNPNPTYGIEVKPICCNVFTVVTFIEAQKYIAGISISNPPIRPTGLLLRQLQEENSGVEAESKRPRDGRLLPRAPNALHRPETGVIHYIYPKANIFSK